MPISGPDRCPECGHAPLLPLDPGCCSECGFEYDSQTLIWRPRRPWRIYFVFINTLIFSPWLFRFLTVTVLEQRWPNASVTLGAVISGVSLAWALPRLRVLLSDGHRYVAVTQHGILARTPRQYYSIPWNDVADVSVLFGVPRVRRRANARLCELDWVFDTDQEVDEFLDAIRHRTPPLFERTGDTSVREGDC